MQSKLVAKANGANYATLEGLGLLSMFSVAVVGALMINYQIIDSSLLTSSTYALYGALGIRAIISFNTELMKAMGVYDSILTKIGAVHETDEYKQELDFNAEHYETMLQKMYEQCGTIIKQATTKNGQLGIEVKICDLCYYHEIEREKKEVNTVEGEEELEKNKQYGGQEILLEQRGKNGENESFSSVSIRSRRMILVNFNLTIVANSIVALVGPSGTGKSTLLNLLTKLANPASGTIYLNNIPLYTLSFSDLQNQISYVTQENYLFRGSLLENLRYGNQGFDCSPSHLLRCLELTNCTTFVTERGGLEMQLTEKAGNLSGGEKQRVIIARALVKRPKLLLLDEATTGLDAESEKIVIANIGRLKDEEGMTVVLVSHKLELFRSIITHVVKLG